MNDTEATLSAQPHNGFFIEVFSDLNRAKDFFLEHLPAKVAKRVDWKSLRLLPSTFVKANLQDVRSDLLFSIELKGTRKKVLLYLLFEHQSTVDASMPLRLLAYMVEIWRTCDPSQPLPPVLPFVLHQGPKTWHVSRQFIDMFKLSPSVLQDLSPYLPKFEHGLLDLSTAFPDRQVQADEVKLVLQLMKLIRQKNKVTELLQWIASQVEASGQPPGELVRCCLIYFLTVNPKLDPKIIEVTLENNPQLKHITMTLEQMLIKQSEDRGKAEGEARGEARGKLQLLQHMMNEPVSTTESLEGFSAQELEAQFNELQREYDRRFKR